MKKDELFNQEIADLKSQITNDLDFKITELYYKEIAPKKNNTFLKSPLLPLFLSAFFAILGTGIGAWLQGKSNIELEQQKYESSLILKMVETDSRSQAITNLDFLLTLGLIKNNDLKDKV